jgi:hypothetical protein
MNKFIKRWWQQQQHRGGIHRMQLINLKLLNNHQQQGLGGIQLLLLCNLMVNLQQGLKQQLLKFNHQDQEGTRIGFDEVDNQTTGLRRNSNRGF